MINKIMTIEQIEKYADNMNLLSIEKQCDFISKELMQKVKNKLTKDSIFISTYLL